MAVVVTLVYAAQSTGSYTTESGSATFSLAGGETLVVMVNAFKLSAVGAPTDSAGSFTKQTAAYNDFVDSGKSHGGWYTQANAAAGSHTITPPAVSGGEDAIIRVYKVSGMPTTLNISGTAKKQQLTASNTFNLTTAASVSVGDIAFGARWHENSAGSTDVITQPAGWTSDIQWLNGAVNLPTDNSHFTVTAAGTLSATWTDIDPAITDTTGALLVLVPLAAAPTITLQPASTTVDIGATATFTIAATGTGTLHYQPKFNGSNVGSDSPTYARSGVVSTDQRGSVTFDVTDDNGTVTSATALLTLNPSSVYLWDTSVPSGNDVWLRDATAYSAGGSTIVSADLNAAGTGASAYTSGATAGAPASMAGIGTLTGLSAATIAATLASTGLGALTGASGTLYAGALASAGAGAFTGASAFLLPGNLSATGIGALTGASAWTAAAALSAAGTGALNATSGALAASVAASAGTGALTGTSAAIGAAAASAAGTGTLTGTGAVILGGVLNATGTASVAVDGDFTMGGGGPVVIEADMNSSSSSTASMIGAAFVQSAASMAGAGSATGASATVLPGVANAAGTGAASLVSGKILAANAQSNGVATAAMNASVIAGSSFSSTGVGAFDAIGNSLTLSIVVMGGAATASFVGDNGALISPFGPPSQPRTGSPEHPRPGSTEALRAATTERTRTTHTESTRRTGTESTRR